MNIKLVKKQSKNTYKNSKGKEVHYYNYFLVLENGTAIQIKCAFPKKDNSRLDVVATYEK